MDWSYHNTTTIHPLAVAMLAITAAWFLLASRRTALIPVTILLCFVSHAQRIVVVGMDFTLMKILILVGFVRMLARGELRMPKFHVLDGVLVCWVVVNMAAYTLLRETGSAFINRLGWLHEVGGTYLMFRLLIRDWDDIRIVLRALIVISIPVAVFFIVEKATGRNLFSIFGGVPEKTLIRDGRLRCQGPFAHPIIAGCFWAALLPTFIALFWRSWLDRVFAVTGFITSLFIVIACSSSTPAMGFILVIGCYALFPFRGWLGYVRWSTLAALVAIHFIREKPIWHLIARIDLSGGSTGWHRYLILDGAIRNWDYWAALGALDLEFVRPGFSDLTNQYVAEGVGGGLLGMILFLISIFFAFRVISRVLRHGEGALTPYQTMMTWALGTALLVHCASFFAVAYFGQSTTIWYLHLALVAGLPALLDSPSAQRERERWAAADAARPRWTGPRRSMIPDLRPRVS